MKATYRKGPWETAHLIDNDGGMVMVQSPEPNRCPYAVALVYGHGGDLETDGERWANAALIAAAPDLLEALRDAAGVLESLLSSGALNSKQTDEADGAVYYALKVIAKAEGE